MGGGIGENTSYVRERIAHFFARENGLKLFQQRIQTKLSRGQTPGLEGAINKLLFGQRVQDMAAFADARIMYGLQDHVQSTTVQLREAYVNTYLGPVDFVFNGPDRQFLSPGLGFTARWDAD